MTKETQDLDTTFDTLGRTPWWKRVYYWFYRRMSGIRNLKRDIECFYYRGKNGYSYMDVWDFDYYLCDVITNGLKLFKANLHGGPHELFDNAAENPTWEWEEVLDKIRDGFIAGKSLMDMDYMDGCNTREEWEPKQKKLVDTFNEGMDLFKEYFFHLWD